jgi:hypothetical protein
MIPGPGHAMRFSEGLTLTGHLSECRATAADLRKTLLAAPSGLSMNVHRVMRP